MTSGTFDHVRPDFIWVDRDKRQRKALDRIEELAKSISENGLIHPPVIKRDGELIVGERRWTAIKTLGWTAMPVQWVDELSEIELHAIEYEENISRVDLPWQEQVLAIEAYTSLRQKQDPEWTGTMTAEALGMSVSEVTKKLRVAKLIQAGDTSIKDAPLYSTARTMMERKEQRAQANAINSIEALVAPKAKPTERIVPLIHADFRDWAKEYKGPKFNMIHCDFPYGVGMHETDQGTARYQFGSYHDEPHIFSNLLRALGEMMHIIDDSAHLMFWFSMDFYAQTLGDLMRMGWTVNRFPLIWIKSDNTGVLPDARRGPRRIYETAFFASRGDRFIVRSKSNAFAYPGREKEIHMNEKPREMLTHFLEMFVDEHTRFLDPTAGSANAVRVAQRLGASSVLGIERDEGFYNLARDSFYADLKHDGPLD